jgi:hypothetical protein
MVFAASQRAKRKPPAASIGCRGPIRVSGFKPVQPLGRAITPSHGARVHQPQLVFGNNGYAWEVFGDIITGEVGHY